MTITGTKWFVSPECTVRPLLEPFTVNHLSLSAVSSFFIMINSVTWTFSFSVTWTVTKPVTEQNNTTQENKPEGNESQRKTCYKMSECQK